MTDHIELSDNGPVRTISMRRPEKKNALTQAMYRAMTQAIVKAQGDEIRCILITGSPGAFSAGNDLEDFLAASSSGQSGAFAAIEFLHALVRNEMPIVAAVDGLAVGIGTTMLLHCDHVVASTTSRFSTPFVQLGLVPEGASSLLAPELMGHRRAFSLLVMGQPLTAEAALAAGLVNTLVDTSQVDTTALKAAQGVAALPPAAVKASRRLLRGDPELIIRRIDEEAKLFAERMRSPEAIAAFKAFLSRKT